MKNRREIVTFKKMMAPTMSFEKSLDEEGIRVKEVKSVCSKT
jgi:hypothetical protein